jgi:transposase InsO family protein
MTDNAKCYVESKAFQQALKDIGANHRRTRNYRPQTNGKAERFIQTLLKEWAYDRAYPNNAARLRRLPRVVETLQSPQTPHRARRAPADLQDADNVSGNDS